MNPWALDSTFWLALLRSLVVGLTVAGVSLGIGWPLGVRASLTTFPCRRPLLGLLAMPLLFCLALRAVRLDWGVVDWQARGYRVEAGSGSNPARHRSTKAKTP
jgi:hypothetical protein